MAPASLRSLCIFTWLVASSLAEPAALGGDAAMEEAHAFLLNARETLGVPARRTLTMDQTATCALDMSSVAGYLTQAGLRLWDAVRHCKKAKDESANANVVAVTPEQQAAKTAAHSDMIMCISDAGMTAQLLTDVASGIMTILESCANRNELSDQCIKNAFSLAGSVSTIGATGASMTNGCMRKENNKAFPIPKDEAVMNCVVNVQAAMQALTSTIASLLTIKQQCQGQDPSVCATASLGIVSSLADLASFILESVGSCKTNTVPSKMGAGVVPCGVEIATTVKALSSIAATATTVKSSCETASAQAPPTTRALTPLKDALSPTEAAQAPTMKAKLLETSRLFDLSSNDAPTTQIAEKQEQEAMPTKPILIGMITLTAIVSFSIGSRTSARNGVQARGVYATAESE